MAIENVQIINQICANSGLAGVELEELRTRLTAMSKEELEAELVTALTGNNSRKDSWVVEHTDSLVDLSNYAKTETTDKEGNKVTEYRDGEYLIERITEGKTPDGKEIKTTITYINNKPFHKYEEIDGKTTVTEYEYSKEDETGQIPYVSVKTTKPDGTIILQEAIFVDPNGNLYENFILNRTTKTPEGEVVKVFLTGEDRLAEIRTNSNNETVRTIYQAGNINDIDKEPKPLRLYQDVVTKKGAAAVKYDGKGNTVTTINAGDGWEKLARRFHTTESKLKALNPKIKNLKAGMDIVVPGEFDAYSKEIAKVEPPEVAKVKAHNAEIDRKIRVEVTKDIKEEYAKALQSYGIKATVENYGFYRAFQSLEDRDKYQVLNAIKYYVQKEKITDVEKIKEKLYENLGYNLYDSGLTVSKHLTEGQRITYGALPVITGTTAVQPSGTNDDFYSRSPNMMNNYGKSSGVPLELFLTRNLKLNLNTEPGRSVYARLMSIGQGNLQRIDASRYGDMSTWTYGDIVRALGVQSAREREQERQMQIRREEIAGDGPIKRKQTIDFALQQVKKHERHWKQN